MFSCFGKNDNRIPAHVVENVPPVSNESATTSSENPKRISKGTNSEKEHTFLRAAHNGNFLKIQEAVNSNIDVNSCNSNGLNALHLASKGGHAEIVQYLIENGADIHAKTRKNNTALHIASLAGCLGVVKILVKEGANVNEQSQTGFTPLYMAAQENHIAVVNYLLEHGADINLSTTDNFTPLAVAIQQGHEETVSILLNKANFQNPIDISNDLKLPPLHIATRKNDYHAVLLLLHHEDDVLAALTQASLNGFTALHIAAYYNSYKVGRLLLENGIPVDYTSKSNVTALHVAAKWGKIEMVKVLLEFNANVELQTRDGIRPLHCAASQGYLEICSLLIDHKADCSAKTKIGLTPLHMVAQGNHAKLVDFFVKQNNANVNEISWDFLTPLHISSHCNNIETGQALIKNGANINLRGLNGFIALHIAAKQNHEEFVKMLTVCSSCLIDTQTENGLTALHIAAIMGYENVLKILIENGCDLNVSDEHERTSLHMATIFNHFNIISYLIEHGIGTGKQIKTGENCLELAIKLENKQVVEYLLLEGASLSITDSWGLSPLHWATLVVRENMLNPNCSEININSAIEIFNIVLNACSISDIDKTTKKNVSCLHLAAEFGSSVLVEELIGKGANTQIRTVKGITPLHFACKSNNHDIVLMLLECLDNESLTMTYFSCGWSPIHFAAYFGSLEALSVLIYHESDKDTLKERINHRTPNQNTSLHLAIQQVQPKIVEILLKNGADIFMENEDGLTAVDLMEIIKDDEISQLIRSDQLKNYQFNSDNIDIFQKEEYSDYELLNELYIDCLNELEYFGIGNYPNEKCGLHLSILNLLDYASTTDSIRRADMSLKINNSLNRYRNSALTEIKKKEHLSPVQVSSMFSTISSTATEMSSFDVEKCDFHRITDFPINSGFLVSFLVDARGGYMQAQRMSKMKIFVPPDAAPAPTRIICHLLRPDNVSNLPGMNDCDGFACRILQIHSSCTRFQKPVLIEMPYIASLRNMERNIIIMKKSFDSEVWKEHTNSYKEENLKEEFGSLYDSITPLHQLEENRIWRIITTDIPHYFALISRFQRNINMIGPEGGFIESKNDKRIKLTFPQGALMKKIQISLEVQNVDPEIINCVVGDDHKISVSPIVTVEPKRRKFRDLIEIQMGLPSGVSKSDLPNLKLLFSISEYNTKWEDVTNSTELTLIEDCIAHCTKISARVWLIFAPEIDNVAELANKIYSCHCPTPYIGRFLAFAKRQEDDECQLRCILITDDTADKTLENQEGFELITTGPESEIINRIDYQIEVAGNIVAVAKLDELTLFPVQSFYENRFTLPLRIRNSGQPFCGKIAFIPNFKSVSKQAVKPVTTLDIEIPELNLDHFAGSIKAQESHPEVKLPTPDRGSSAIEKTEVNLQDLSNKIGSDWFYLSKELKLDSKDIELILNNNCTDEDKALQTLIKWKDVNGPEATDDELFRALRNIDRDDIEKSSLDDLMFEKEQIKSAIDNLNDEEKNNLDRCWCILPPNDKNIDNNGSIDESMIVETGDYWSQSPVEEKSSDVSDDKPSDIPTNPEMETECELEIKPIIDVTRTVKSVERTPSEKLAVFLLLIDELEQTIPEPVLPSPALEKTRQIGVCNESMVKLNRETKQVEDVDKNMSLLNLINCQINEDKVKVDTIMDLDQFFPEPQEIDVEKFSLTDLNEYGDFRDHDECVIEVCIPGDKSSPPVNKYEDCEITNALLNMKKEELIKTEANKDENKAAVMHRRYTIDKAKLLRHNDMFHFHPPVSPLRRCFSVDSKHGDGMFNICSHIKNIQAESIVEMADWSSDDDLKIIEVGKDFEEYPRLSIETQKENNNNLIFVNKPWPGKETIDDLSTFICESPIMDIDNFSLSDDMEKSNEDKEVNEICFETKTQSSQNSNYYDIDMETDQEMVSALSSPELEGGENVSESAFNKDHKTD